MKKLVKKIVKGILFFLIGLLLIVNLFILLSGRYYIYSGIAKTYLRGETGPGIYDLDLFPKTTIKSASQNFKWTNHPKKNSYNFSEKQTSYHQEWGTTAFLVIKNDSILFEKYWGSIQKKRFQIHFQLPKPLFLY